MSLPTHIYLPSAVANAVERRLNEFERRTGAVIPMDYRSRS